MLIERDSQDLESNKLIDDLEVEKRTLQNEELRKITGISELLSVAECNCIDNDKTIGSEPVYRSLWDEIELAEIKSLIMKKIRKL